MILVGTSGWQYDDWRGRLYPRDLSKRKWLEHFSRIFPVVEVNNTFYNLPKPETFSRWREESDDGFLFVIKASRYITHIRRLRDCREPVSLLWSGCRRLGGKRGPVLFQLPPTLRADVELLRAFLRTLPRSMRAAFEFRHPSWATEEVHEALDAAGAALVLADRPGARVPDVVTGGWTYLRFHQGRPGAPGYPRSKLRRFADRLARSEAGRAYVFFNNDQRGAAVDDAVTLTELLRKRAVTVRGPATASAR
jgi:uncharacterized protein YecE (DUF72 family)